MVDEILAKTGVKYRQNRFVKPPRETYIIWRDDIETDGPDGMPPQIFMHGISFEMYEYVPDPDAEAAVEGALTESGMHWTKQDRFWIEVEQLYQTVYEFSYIEKRRN